MNDTHPPLVRQLARTGKAIAALIVCAAAYMVGILSGDQGLTDVTTVQWLGLIVFLGAAYGITWVTPNAGVVPAERVVAEIAPAAGVVVAGPASAETNGTPVNVTPKLL